MPVYNIEGHEITEEEFNIIAEERMAEISVGDRVNVKFPQQLGGASFSGKVVDKSGSNITLDVGRPEKTNVWAGFVE